MRRQLSQPSFVNGFARSRGESVRPDLWPDHAWVPALGNQGATLFDICHVPSTSNGTIEACTWGQNKLLFDGSTSYVWLPLNTDMENYPVCVFSAFESTIIATRQYLYSIAYGGGSRRHHSIGIEASTGVALNGAYSAGASFIYSANSITAGLNCIYAEWVVSTYRSIRLNSGAVVTATSEQVMEPSLLAVCRIGQNYNNYDTALMFAGAVHEVLLYKRQLTDNQYNDLRGDYLLPFRRRTVQKYWVPAGGGTTDALTSTSITTGAPVLGTPTIAQIHALQSAAITTGAPSIATPTVGQIHALSAGAIATGAPVMATPTLEQIHALTSGAIATGAPVLSTPTIGQIHALSAAGITTGAPTLGEPTVSESSHPLTATGITTGAPVLGTPTIGQVHALAAGAIATGAPTLATPTIGQIHALAAGAILAGTPVLGTPWVDHDLFTDALTATDITAGAPILFRPFLNFDPAFTPNSRTNRIPYENRTNRIPYENRTNRIAKEN